MENSLFHSLLADEKFAESHRLAQRAVEKELSKNNYPIIPNPEACYLHVSFPNQCGLATYTIETTSRKFVGAAFAADREDQGIRRGLVTTLLFESPIFAAAEGRFGVSRVEVWHRDVMIGSVKYCSSKERFELETNQGNAYALLRGGIIHICNDVEVNEFHLRMDTSKLRKPNAEPDQSPGDLSSVIYKPDFKLCNPVVVMAFLLSIKMIFKTSDF